MVQGRTESRLDVVMGMKFYYRSRFTNLRAEAEIFGGRIVSKQRRKLAFDRIKSICWLSSYVCGKLGEHHHAMW